MESLNVQPLLDWVATHQTWAGLAIFLISVSESLIVVGLFVPGTVVMFGIGALVATGSLELWSTLGWAALGAVVGDGISYWVGYYYQDRLRDVWPFKRYPKLMARGEAFFCKHGGKSILFGRFVGPVRPMIPAVAGMMGMSPLRFTTVNIASALVWAPAYTLPGVVFGASMGLASQVAMRLTVLLLAVCALFWLSIWLTRRIFLYAQPRAQDIIARLLDWSRTHPHIGTLARAILDPREPETRGLLIIALLLLLSGWGLLHGLTLLLGSATLAGWDTEVLHTLQSLRTPWADDLMIMLAGLGHREVTVPLIAAVFIWLSWKRHWLAVWHWGAAMLFGASLSLVLAMPGAPLTVATLVALPAETAMVMVMYGFLAVLIARELPGRWRWAAYSVAASFIMAVSIARLYLGVHWPSYLFGALVFALVWVTLLGIAYRRHLAPRVSIGGLAAVTLLVVVSTTLWHITHHYNHDVAAYAPRHSVEIVSTQAWWSGTAWRDTPIYRIDLKGEQAQPLTLQWAGNLNVLQQHLKTQGWHTPARLTAKSSLQWLSPTPQLEQQPILPQVHDGHHEAWAMTHPGRTPDRVWVIRLWPAGLTLQENGAPVWVGTLSEVRLTPMLHWLTLLRTTTDIHDPLTTLRPYLTGLAWQQVQRPLEQRTATKQTTWHGEVLLLTATPPP